MSAASGIDLNLLRLLDALIAERSLTRAAKQLGLSQPAASHALARLREQTGDPLFVKAGRGLSPTRRAEHLGTAARSALATLDAAFESSTVFDPATTRRTYRISTSDFVGPSLLPALVAVLTREAPHATLDLRTPEGSPFTQLRDGSLDLAIGRHGGDEDGFYAQPLFKDEFVCVLRKSHPLLRRFDLDAYCALSHVLVTPRSDSRSGPVDVALAKLGRKRRVVVTLPSFAMAAAIVRGSDLVCTLPSRTVHAEVTSRDLVVVELPIALSKITASQVWHARQHQDPAHGFLRGLVRRVALA